MGPWGIRLSDGRLLLQHTTPTRRLELLAYDLEIHDYETILATEYDPFESADFAETEYVTIESTGVSQTAAAAIDHEPAKNLEIEALLLDPAPLVVNPHGGPRSQDTTRFSIYTQVLVMQGYAVLQVNYRGSTGRGREFVEELIDDRVGLSKVTSRPGLNTRSRRSTGWIPIGSRSSGAPTVATRLTGRWSSTPNCTTPVSRGSASPS